MFRFTVLAAAALSIASSVDGQYAPLIEDNTAILDVPGRKDVNPNGWGDSYSVGSSCYCKTNYDHHIDVIPVSTPLGNMTVKQACTILGPGPGSTGRPRYNDVQCGHGPANDAGDEDTCPGRIEYGKTGCKYIGPKWNFTGIKLPVQAPTKAPLSAPIKVPVLAPVPVRVPVPTPVHVKVPVPVPVPVRVPAPTPVHVKAPVSSPVVTTNDGNVGIFLEARQKSGTRFSIIGSTKLNSSPNGTISSGVAGHDANLFRSHRWSASSFSYSISGFLPGLSYAVTLGFAETYQPNCATGKRVFNIAVNGISLVSNFDTFAVAGCKSASVITQTVLANGTGRIEISFAKIRENPFVSFINIVPL